MVLKRGRVGGRFTPTCVGKAKAQPRRICASTVHPHVRGEGVTIPWCDDRDVGSPPRAWGRRDPPRCIQRGSRFTPTCVGKAVMEG